MPKFLIPLALMGVASLARADTFTALTLPTLNTDIRTYSDGAAFGGETLLTIRFTGNDLGQSGIPFIAAATVAVASPVPEAATYMLMLIGLGLVGGSMYRRGTGQA